MKKLIVNADDLGLSASVNAGIARAHQEGIVTAATCLVGLPGFGDAIQTCRDHPSLDPGLHLNLTWGQPSHDQPLPRLAPEGRFRGKQGLAAALLLGRIPEDEVACEVRAQLRTFTEQLGPPSHVDVHQHLHVFGRVWRPLLDELRTQEVPFIRTPDDATARGLMGHVARTFRGRAVGTPPPRRTDAFRGLSRAGKLDEHSLIDLITTLETGITELMVHPGERDGPHVPEDRLQKHRAREREALCAPRVQEALEEHEIVLTTFRAEASTA